MKRFLLLALPLLLIQAASADDQLRNVQRELKNQGFYYGDVNGQASGETTAALRRYQIRHGLEVTGTLNTETLHTIGGSGAAAKVPTASVSRQTTPPGTRKTPVEESDRAFLRREEQNGAQPAPSPPAPQVSPPSVALPGPQTVPPAAPEPAPPTPAQPGPRDPSIIPPPAPLYSPSGDYSAVFADTPYATATREVQEQTLRRAQSMLADRGFYRDTVDGIPGPATEEALLNFQRAARRPLTGHLDLQTLNDLRLLRGRSANPPLQPFTTNRATHPIPPPMRIYRGILAE